MPSGTCLNMLASTVAFITLHALCAAMFRRAASGFAIHGGTLLVLTLSITWYVLPSHIRALHPSLSKHVSSPNQSLLSMV
jgi:hypothetical protein